MKVPGMLISPVLQRSLVKYIKLIEKIEKFAKKLLKIKVKFEK